MSAVTAVPIRPIARGAVLKLWIALIFLIAAAAGLAWWTTRTYQMVTLPSGVRYRVLVEGSGPQITPADVAAMRYRLHANSPDAPVVQDSDEGGRAFVATVGSVYSGFGEGLQHMRAGGRYLLWLPPGTHEAAPGFSTGDTMVFEIQLVQIAQGQAPAFEAQRMQELQQQLQARMQQQGGAPAGPHGETLRGEPGQQPGQ